MQEDRISVIHLPVSNPPKQHLPSYITACFLPIKQIIFPLATNAAFKSSKPFLTFHESFPFFQPCIHFILWLFSLYRLIVVRKVLVLCNVVLIVKYRGIDVSGKHTTLFLISLSGMIQIVFSQEQSLSTGRMIVMSWMPLRKRISAAWTQLGL